MGLRGRPLQVVLIVSALVPRDSFSQRACRGSQSAIRWQSSNSLLHVLRAPLSDLTRGRDRYYRLIVVATHVHLYCS